jgi:hypothetical protein
VTIPHADAAPNPENSNVRVDTPTHAPSLPTTVLKLTIMYAAATFMASLAAYATAMKYGHPDQRPLEFTLAAILLFGGLWAYSIYRILFPNDLNA